MNSLFEDQEDNFQEEIVKGKAIKIDERTIYPIIQVTTLELQGKFRFESISPIAIAIIESDNRYFIPFDEENDEINELLKREELWDELGIEI